VSNLKWQWLNKFQKNLTRREKKVKLFWSKQVEENKYLYFSFLLKNKINKTQVKSLLKQLLILGTVLQKCRRILS